MPIRQQWIDAIQSHQLVSDIDKHTLKYYVCKLHFNEEDFKKVFERIQTD